MSFEPLLDCWYLTGPTASGKTAVGLALARRLGAEIVSLDSMAVYRGMDIGTAKPTRDEREAVPHHLIDVVDPSEAYSVARYVETAHAIVDKIRGRGKTPLFVGGTPLYLKSLLRGIFRSPPADPMVRNQLRTEALSSAPGHLHARLREVDPTAAAKLHPNDTKRLIRALEVFHTTGQPISVQQQQFDRPRATADQLRVFALQWPRHALHARINQRVERMFAAGLVDEVRQLLERWPSLSHTASQAVGYREVIEHLEGRHDLAHTIELVQNHTRQLAKRQETWFRSLAECRFVAMREGVEPDVTADQIVYQAG